MQNININITLPVMSDKEFFAGTPAPEEEDERSPFVRLHFHRFVDNDVTTCLGMLPDGHVMIGSAVSTDSDVADDVLEDAAYKSLLATWDNTYQVHDEEYRTYVELTYGE